MNIAIFDTVLNPGGGHRFSHLLIKAIAESDSSNQVKLITGFDVDSRSWYQDLPNLSHQNLVNKKTLIKWLPDGRILNVPGTWKLKKSIREILLSPKITQYLLASILKDTDLVYFPWPTDHLPIAEACFENKPVFVTIHDTLWHDLDGFSPNDKKIEDEKIERWLNIATGVVPITNHLYHRLFRLYPKVKARFKTIHQAVPLLPEARDETERNLLLKRINLTRPFILYPAGLWPHKNHFGLLKAFSILIRKGKKLQLVFTGSETDIAFTQSPGEFLPRFPELVRKKTLSLGLKPGDDVIGLGYVNDRILTDLYTMASAVVIPSFAEGCSFTVLEAASLHKPVACSQIPAHQEMAEYYQIRPTFFDPNNEFSIADSIEKIIKSNSNDLSLPSDHPIYQRSWSEVASSYLDFFSTLI